MGHYRVDMVSPLPLAANLLPASETNAPAWVLTLIDN
jgi:hypothetical protein